MRTNEAAGSKTPDWRKLVAPFGGADTRRSLFQLITTLLLFAGSWAAMYFSLAVSYWLTLALAIPTAALLVRLFMIQHDCGHGSYFRSRRARDLTGFFLGVLTLTPYRYWQKTHAYHHSHSGDLDFRGFGDIDTYTVEEYRALSKWRRIAYRFYRHPAVLFGGGAAFHFLVKHRYPWDIPRSWKAAWRGVWLTNAVLAALIVGVGMTIGFRELLMIQLPITLLSSAIGVWLFYVQHQFENTYWHRHDDWNYYEAAIFGSSHLVLPKPLQWLTASIGLHHVHHLSSMIPNYRLEECLNANPDFQKATRINMRETWRLMKLTLWDEANERLISFREARQLLTAAAQ
ncbi:fatty acid desaturase [bacterium]|nr:fatty acid desaturase [bacterium]